MKRFLPLVCALLLLNGTAALAATPAPTQSAAPTPQVTPAPTATAAPQGETVVQAYDFTLPQGLTLALQYDRYPAYGHYFMATKTCDVLSAPQEGAQRLERLGYGERRRCDALVQGGDGKQYYRINLEDDAATVAYAPADRGEHRSFDINNAFARILLLEQYADDPFTVMIGNYKNKLGKAPRLADGSYTDARGYPNDQAAPAYDTYDAPAPVCYLPDGLILVQYESYAGRTRVYSPTCEAFYWVPDAYLTRGDALQALNQVCVVNNYDQNITVYERNAQGSWEIIGMSFVATGTKGGGARPTMAGDYRVIETRPKFVYDNDNDKIYDGYALWTTRFSCGGYLHGSPTGYTYDPETMGDMSCLPNTSPEGGLTSMGTVPKSHMCVRNYTSFAKFIYDRIQPQQAMVLVMGEYTR